MKDLFSLTQTPKGKKPIGYEIDWSHPLTRNLKLYIDYGYNPRDLVKDSISWWLGVIPDARIKHGIEESNDWDAPKNLTINDSLNMSDGKGTLIARASGLERDAKEYPRLFQGGGTGYSNSIIYFSSTSILNARFTGTTQTYTSSTPLIGSAESNSPVIEAAITWDDTINEVKFYINGELKQTSTASISARGFGDRLGPFHDSDNGNSLNGGKRSFSLHSRVLSEIEIKSLHQDPYQFLKPASLQDAVYSALFGTSGTATIAAHVMHYFKQMRQ